MTIKPIKDLQKLQGDLVDLASLWVWQVIEEQKRDSDPGYSKKMAARCR